MKRHLYLLAYLGSCVLVGALLADAYGADTGNDSDPINTLPAVSPNSSSYAAERAFDRDEDADRFDELFAENPVVSGCVHSTAAGKTGTFTATPCIAYPGGYRVSEPAATINYSALAANTDTCWTIATMADSGSPGGNFSRISGTHYAVDCTSTTTPSLPADSAWLMAVTFSGGAITAVTDLRQLTLGHRRICYIDDYDAGGAGLTSDTAALVAAVADCDGYNGTVVATPGRTYLVSPTAANSPIVTLGGPVTLWLYGATFKIAATTSTDATSFANEVATSWLFKASNIDGITILGGTFDGDRDTATTNRHGFFHGVRTNDVTIRDTRLLRSGNTYGFIYLTAWDGSDGEQLYNINIESNYIAYGHYAINIEESMRSVRIHGNRVEWLDLPSTYTDFYGTAGRSNKGIRLTGFLSTTAATHGDIDGIEITNNIVHGAAIPIEFWNECAGGCTGSNYNSAADSHNIVISSNKTWGPWGILVNSHSNVTIANNTILRLNSGDVTAYAGEVGTLTSGNYLGAAPAHLGGALLEAEPGFGYTVTGNTVDGGFNYTTQANNVVCSSVGRNDSDQRNDSHNISGNSFNNCYYGTIVQQVQDVTIANNTYTGCWLPVFSQFVSGSGGDINTAVTPANNIFSGNTVRGDSASLSAATPGASDAVAHFEGSWHILNNTLIGYATMTDATALVLLRGFDRNEDGTSEIGDYVVNGNIFHTYQYRAVNFNGSQSNLPLSLQFNGNTCDTNDNDGTVATTTACIGFTRPGASNTVNVRMGVNTVFNVDHPIHFSSTGGGTENYDFGMWKDGDTATPLALRLWRHDGGGSANTPLAINYRAGTNLYVIQRQVDLAVDAASATVTGGLPAASQIHGVTTFLDEAIATATSFDIGYGTSTDTLKAWGNDIAVAANTVTRPSDWLSMVTGSATNTDVGSISDGDEAVVAVTVTGAVLGDSCIAASSADVGDLTLTAHVTSTNNVDVNLANNTGGPVDPASGLTYTAWCRPYAESIIRPRIDATADDLIITCNGGNCTNGTMTYMLMYSPYNSSNSVMF